MTISDIAKMAGVSSAAVSRYLNGGPLSEQKREAIREVVEKTGYRPDAALCADLAAVGIDFVRVGDCKKVGKIINGVWEAFQITYRI